MPSFLQFKPLKIKQAKLKEKRIIFQLLLSFCSYCEVFGHSCLLKRLFQKKKNEEKRKGEEKKEKKTSVVLPVTSRCTNWYT